MELPNVSQEIMSYFESKIRRSPTHVLRASEIGDPCERYLYYSVVDWDKRRMITPETQALFDLGSHLEELAIKLLKATGWKVEHQWEAFEWKDEKKHITGYADVFITREGLPPRIPCEIKFLMDYGDKFQTWEDMVRSDRRWVQRYPAQLLTYMLLKGSEIGLFLIMSKQSNQPNHIWFDFNDDNLLNYAESIIQKAERVWGAIQKKELPERIDPKQGLCLDCDFVQHCQPPLWFGDEAIQLDKRVEELLDRRADLQPFNSEFDKINKELKRLLEGVQNAVAGRWLIQGTLVERKGYVVENGTYWKHTFKKISEI